MGLCQSIAENTKSIPFGTSIVNIYTRHAQDYASSASYIHEISGGRFRFGVGVSHAPMNDRLSVSTGRPLQDTEKFIHTYKESKRVGELPPIIMPNYRNYWKSVGYKNEMERIEVALSEKDYASLPSLMTDKWLEDVSLFGSPSEVKEGIEKWYETGLETPILVPSSTDGGQFKAFEELFDLFT